jgi:hypothetical protein
VTTESDPAVPRPQQARTRGQLVVYRTDSEQENLLLLPLLQLLRKIRRPLLLPNTVEDPPPSTTTTTTFVTEIILTFRIKASRSIVPRVNNIV